MKKILSVILTFVLLASLFTNVQIVYSQEFEWVLVDVIGYPNEEGWAQANLHESYSNIYSYSHGMYTVTTTYDGRAEEWRNPPKKTGENITLKGSFEDIPQRFSAEEEVSVTINMKAENNNQSFFAFSASAHIQFDNVDIKPGSRGATSRRFIDGNENDSFLLESTNDYDEVNKTITVSAPKGREEGDQIAILATFFRGVAMGTSYIYEWRPAGWNAEEIPSYTSNNEKETPVGVVPPSSWFTFPEDYPEVGSPADIFVTDLYGEVEVHVFDNGLWDTYSPVLGENLPENAVISTMDDSGIQLYIEGLGPFMVRPNTDIGIGSRPEEEGKLSIFFGHVWGNFKEAMRTGYMDIPMSQAAAGIKGTTFELIDDGETSTVLVYEGEVEFKSNNLDTSVSVGSGETVMISEAEVGMKKAFDVEAELAKWDQETQSATLLAIEEYQATIGSTDDSAEEEPEEEILPIDEAIAEGGQQDGAAESSSFPIVLVGGAALVLSAAVALIILSKKKKSKKISRNTSSNKYQDPYIQSNNNNSIKKYCKNCGNELNVNSKFCKECGQSQEN
jgi:hypothetical protein